MEDLAVVGDKPKFQVGDLAFLNNLTFSNLAVRIIGVEKYSDGYYYELKNDKGVLYNENVLSEHPKLTKIW
jgi:hypothetical protein